MQLESRNEIESIDSQSLSSSSEDEQAEVFRNLLLHPLKRSDILGKDEDLESIEEFYLKEIQEIVNGDEIQKMKNDEHALRRQINDYERKMVRRYSGDVSKTKITQRLLIAKQELK